MLSSIVAWMEQSEHQLQAGEDKAFLRWRLLCRSRRGRRSGGTLRTRPFLLLLRLILVLLDGTDDHVRIAAFQLGLAFHGPVRRKILCETKQQLTANIGMRDF